MADTNQSPPRQTEPIARTVAELTRNGPQPHACDAPDLSPIEFLQTVYRDRTLPMSIRIDAARGLLPFTEPRPATVPSWNGCTIVIPPLCSPWPRSTEIHSQNPDPASITLTRDDEAVAPVNIETTPHPDFVPDYSTPPTPAELQEIKAAVNRLRPDLAHLPVPEFHLCPCGHWITGEYDCCRRELSKLN